MNFIVGRGIDKGPREQPINCYNLLINYNIVTYKKKMIIEKQPQKY